MASISRSLRRTLCTLSTTTASKSIKTTTTDLYRERDLSKLVQKFKQSSEIDRFRSKTGVYEDTVRRLSIAKRFNWIEEIIEDQKKYSDISKEGFTVRLISLYGKSGMFDHAQKLFDEMPDLKCTRSVLSFNALLGACINAKQFDKVEAMFRELPSKLSVKPDIYSYNVYIKGLCEMGSFDSAIAVIDEMGKQGFKPDLVTFNTLYNGLYRNGRLADGEKMWTLMEKNGIVPNIMSYNARLTGLAMEKKTSEAVELVDEIREKGIKLDVCTMNALIKGFCNDENLEEAKKWYCEIKTQEFAPIKATFATLVPFVCAKGDTDTAFTLFKDVFKYKCLVDESVLQAVVNTLVKASKIEEAKELVELGKSNKYCRFNLKLPSEE